MAQQAICYRKKNNCNKRYWKRTSMTELLMLEVTWLISGYKHIMYIKHVVQAGVDDMSWDDESLKLPNYVRLFTVENIYLSQECHIHNGIVAVVGVCMCILLSTQHHTQYLPPPTHCYCYSEKLVGAVIAFSIARTLHHKLRYRSNATLHSCEWVLRVRICYSCEWLLR